MPRRFAVVSPAVRRTEINGLNTRLRNLQRRLGAREELIAVVILGLLAASGLSFTLLTNQVTPAAAALAYMAAVDRADTGFVSSHSIIDSAIASSTDTSLLDRSALGAQLAATAHTRSGFSVQNVSAVNADTEVTLTYNTSAGRRTTNLIMRAQRPNSWPVLVEPAGLDLNIPSGAGALAIDGQAVVASPGSEVTVAVFPGQHTVTLAASTLFTPYAGEVEAQLALPALTAVSFSMLELSDTGTTQADKAVSQAIKSCAGSTSLSPTGCPQTFGQDLATGAANWTLLGDPLNGSSIGLDDTSTLLVTGHFLMRLSYGSATTQRPRILAVGGPYTAALSWDGQALKFSDFQDASAVTDVPHPAATDAQVLAALKTHFDACLKLQAGSAPGCLQIVNALFASKFTWHEVSDPLQGAILAWDGSRAVFTVSGSYDLSVVYNSSAPFTPTRRIHDTSSGQYIADLYWDGSKVVFIGLEK